MEMDVSIPSQTGFIAVNPVVLGLLWASVEWVSSRVRTAIGAHPFNTAQIA
jgi:hypothetical protein